MTSPLGTVTDEGLRTALDAKRAEASRLWADFSTQRDRAVQTGRVDAETVKKLEDLHADYKAVADEALRLEHDWLASVSTKAVRGLEPPSSITDSFLKSIGGIEAMKTIQSGTWTLPAVFSDDIAALPQASMFISSVMRTVNVGTPQYGYLQNTVTTNAAAPVAAGGLKPTSILTLQQVVVIPQTIATITEALERNLLMDYESLRTFLDQQLRQMVLLALEGQVINGSGVAPNLRGILNTPGIATVPMGSDTAADALYHAVTAVRLANIAPDAIVMHPSDFETVRLSKNSTEDYLAASVVASDPNTIFGLPVILSPVVPEGTAIVGNFLVGAYVVQREDVTLEIASTGLGDAAGTELFSRNQLRARAEMRAGLAVPFPQAFAAVTGLDGTP